MEEIRTAVRKVYGEIAQSSGVAPGCGCGCGCLPDSQQTARTLGVSIRSAPPKEQGTNRSIRCAVDWDPRPGPTAVATQNARQQ